MTNATMFVYTIGIVMKKGTANAWNQVYELSKTDENLKKWFESPYTQMASQDDELVKILNKNGL